MIGGCHTTQPENNYDYIPALVPALVPAPTPTTGLTIAVRYSILRRDKSILLAIKMTEDDPSVVKRALPEQKTQEHIQLTNLRRNSKGSITVVTP